MPSLSPSSLMPSFCISMATIPNCFRTLAQHRAPLHFHGGRAVARWSLSAPTGQKTASSRAHVHSPQRVGPSQDRSQENKFYAFYLNTKPRIFHPHEITDTWLQGLSRHESTTKRSQEPIDGLLSLFSDHNASMDQAIANLEALMVALHRGVQGKEAARERIDAQRVGQRALLWFLESRAYHRFEILLYPKFIELVAYALTGQRSEKQLWNLIFTDDALGLSTAHQAIWKGRVLRALVQAKAYWAPGRDSVNSAFYCFEQAFASNAKDRRMRDLCLRIPLTPAGQCLEELYMRTDPSSVRSASLTASCIRCVYYMCQASDASSGKAACISITPSIPTPIALSSSTGKSTA